VRNTYKISVGKPEEKRTLKKPKCKWEDNIKIYSTLKRDLCCVDYIKPSLQQWLVFFFKKLQQQMKAGRIFVKCEVHT
jgi:hypothetical protein